MGFPFHMTCGFLLHFSIFFVVYLVFKTIIWGVSFLPLSTWYSVYFLYWCRYVFLDLGGVFFCHGFEGMFYVIDLGLFFIRLCLWFKDFVFSWCPSVPPCSFQLFNLFTFPAVRSNTCTSNLELSAVFYLTYSTYEDTYLPKFSDGVLEVLQLHLYFSLSSSQYSYL